MKRKMDTEQSLEKLKVILESAYNAIIAVDSEGKGFGNFMYRWGPRYGCSGGKIIKEIQKPCQLGRISFLEYKNNISNNSN